MATTATLSAPPTGAKRTREPRVPAPLPLGVRFLRSQGVNTARHAQTVRAFTLEEFGVGASRPRSAHVAGANRLVAGLRQLLAAETDRLRVDVPTEEGVDAARVLRRVLAAKHSAHKLVGAMELVWDFYFEIFRQRATHYGPWLLAADRIGLDCYQAVYTRLGRPRSIPTPSPFCHVENGLSPATYRRGVSVPGLSNLPNPFPLIQLPLHRLVNPWTLGAIPHEVAHNLQADLDLWQEVPRRVARNLGAVGLPKDVVKTWTLWHKEIWADLCGLLLGGPAIATSLLDLLARPAHEVARFNPRGVHPPPYLRMLTTLEALARMGFEREARAQRSLWTSLYPHAPRALPGPLAQTFERAKRIAVETMILEPYEQLGGRTLRAVTGYRPRHDAMVAEAAQRVAVGEDPGILPARFFIGAARVAMDTRAAPPHKIADNFYRALNER